MKVKAIGLGYYGEKRRKPDFKGSVFTLKNVADFSPRWMRVVSATSGEKSQLMDILKKRAAILNDPSPKRIKVVEHSYSNVESKFDPANKDQFEELFDDEAMDAADVADKKREGKQKAKKEREEAEGQGAPQDLSQSEGADEGSVPVPSAPPVAARKSKGSVVPALKEESPL